MKLNINMAIVRCDWCERDDLYREYHDVEWGKPVWEDGKIFEFLVLESFQAGLSWHIILKKRNNFRLAFDDFDYKIIAHYGNEKIQQLLGDEGIIRNRMKILATVNNAKRFMEVQEEFGSFANYIWSYVDGTPIINLPKTLAEIPAISPRSDALAKDLKKRGFKFLGSTVMYAHMQATGLVNDHVADCWCSAKNLASNSVF